VALEENRQMLVKMGISRMLGVGPVMLLPR
jgi:hypothetical protein